ncbi:MAG: hypothetical protein GC150_13745 [Rhizobiales bacterium]|nr:hypothetical protein [Hyphomicrobiales bacterium]
MADRGGLRLFGLACCLVLAMTAGVLAGQDAELEGPLPATVLRVVDGDTIDVRVTIWIGQTVETRVRLAGVEAPELTSRCAAERLLGERAKLALSERIAGRTVLLSAIRPGKYAGRVIATVAAGDIADLGHWLIAGRLARSYRDGRTCPGCTRRIACEEWASLLVARDERRNRRGPNLDRIAF